jgi:hypothetical protein
LAYYNGKPIAIILIVKKCTPLFEFAPVKTEMHPIKIKMHPCGFAGGEREIVSILPSLDIICPKTLEFQGFYLFFEEENTNKPFRIKIDGRSRVGVVLKPE